jgi:2-oxoglutarate dehydrogenase E2 component (dihydrolipoamide succinyltransferase)
MAQPVKIPALGESVAGGMIAKWHFNTGDIVKQGDILLTLETDKVAAEVTAEASGKITVLKPEGEDVEIGTVVAEIDTEAAAPASPAPEPPAAPADAAPAAATAPAPAASKPDAAEPAQAEPKPAPPPEPKAAPAPAPSGDRPVTRQKMSPLRRKIADQLVSAQQTAAILTTFNECDMSTVMDLRKRMQEGFVAKHGVKLGFMSFFIKAVVEALKAVPAINSRIEGNELVQQHYFDIGVAVGTERGLVVPVLRDCDQKSFADLEREILEHAGKARDGKLQVTDLTGGVFTISNGGVYGSLLSTPILNPPQSGILGMHSIQQRPVALNGQVVIRPMMYLALSYDHRVVDGKEAVSFLIRVKDCIENPARMLVGA